VREQTPAGYVNVTAINMREAVMVQLEVVPAQVEALAQEAHAKIDQSLARSGADNAAFWHAVALVYRRGLPVPVPRTAELGLPRPVRDHLGHQLQASYASVFAKAQPPHHLALVAQIDTALRVQGEMVASQFSDDLLAALSGLRVYATSLTMDPCRADDLVQETLVRAWANQHRFEPNSNLMGWLCTILRNQFYTECRKRKREVEDVDGAAATQMITLAAQEHGAELRKVWASLNKLPPRQREALLLVGAQGMTYEAAAALVGCQVGTVKSRVSRARAFLTELLERTDERIPA
jgi:RNA polymerase sigma-70 factor (ECF subfamily)